MSLFRFRKKTKVQPPKGSDKITLVTSGGNVVTLSLRIPGIEEYWRIHPSIPLIIKENSSKPSTVEIIRGVDEGEEAVS